MKHLYELENQREIEKSQEEPGLESDVGTNYFCEKPLTLPTLSEPEQDSMRAFLFACFTGLRFSDLKVLERDEIVDWKIRKKDAQSEEIIYIPIPEQARSLIPKRFTNGPVFRIVDNSHFNRTLRIAAEKLGCKKRINCNMARHTFATVCIFLGIPVTAISKILGHMSADSTLIYTK